MLSTTWLEKHNDTKLRRKLFSWPFSDFIKYHAGSFTKNWIFHYRQQRVLAFNKSAAVAWGAGFREWTNSNNRITDGTRKQPSQIGTLISYEYMVIHEWMHNRLFGYRFQSKSCLYFFFLSPADSISRGCCGKYTWSTGWSGKQVLSFNRCVSVTYRSLNRKSTATVYVMNGHGKIWRIPIILEKE